MSRQEALDLLNKYIENENLIKHCKMVGTAMEAYAKKLGKDQDEVEKWWTAGVLHDLDWEKYPEEHPNKAINEILPEAGFKDPEILNAIAAHGPDRTGVEPESEMAKYLFACDELSGFLNAASLVRPTRFEGMKFKSIKKRLKSPAFAAGVSRDDINKGIDLIGTPLNEHVEFLIDVFTKEGY